MILAVRRRQVARGAGYAQLLQVPGTQDHRRRGADDSPRTVRRESNKSGRGAVAALLPPSAPAYHRLTRLLLGYTMMISVMFH